ILTGPPRTGPFNAAAVPSPASAGTPATAFRKFRRPIACCSGVSCTWRLVESAAFYSPRSRGGHREISPRRHRGHGEIPGLSHVSPLRGDGARPAARRKLSVGESDVHGGAQVSA